MNRNNIRENKAGKEMELNQNQEKLKEYRKRAKELVAQMTLEKRSGRRFIRHLQSQDLG